MASTNVTRTDTGVFTVEGNVAGRRAAGLTKAREREKADYEKRKRDIEIGKTAPVVKHIDAKFAKTGTLGIVDDEFSAKHVGLITVEEFRRQREIVEKKKQQELARLAE
jgi:protein FAM50